MSAPHFTVEHVPESRTLRVSGELEAHGTAALRSAIAQHSDDYTTELSVDLSDVTYCPSAAIAMLVTATKLFRASSTPFELTASDGSIAQRVLTLCGIAHRSS